MTGRRQWLLWLTRGAVALALGGAFLGRRRAGRTRWQIDPLKCTQCGRCATFCVLTPSAVKCVHAYAMCGYCKLCFGYFQPDAPELSEAAENQLCPTGAIRRTFVEDPYFEYTIDEPACVGCGLCVKGCASFGNGSLFLQIRHDRCVNCNECAIARACPAQAIGRVPEEHPYILKGAARAVADGARLAGRAARTAALLGLLLLFVSPAAPAAEARFPQPQFESGHVVPTAAHPDPGAWLTPALDVAVLGSLLLLTAWIMLRRRSRRLALLLAALAGVGWFGFVRRGCVCPVGGIQNVAEALGPAAGALPWSVALFVLLPLLAALFFGRVFCSALCPLGALQELGTAHPLRLPRPLDALLRLGPVAVLAVTVALAVNGGGYLLCESDPYISFYRLSGGMPRLLLGLALLLLGLVVARPYCRYFCPYGLLLGWCSRFAWRHVTITPAECVRCRLCERVCPVDAILPPVVLPPGGVGRGARRTLLLHLMALPLLLALGALSGARGGLALARRNPDVALAANLAALADSADLPAAEVPLDVAAFRLSGGNEQELRDEVLALQGRMRRAGGWAGAFFGGVLGWRLLGLLRRRRREDYTIDRARCVSCGRCFDVCPVLRKAAPSYPSMPAVAGAVPPCQRATAAEGRGRP